MAQLFGLKFFEPQAGSQLEDSGWGSPPAELSYVPPVLPCPSGRRHGGYGVVGGPGGELCALLFSRLLFAEPSLSTPVVSPLIWIIFMFSLM